MAQTGTTTERLLTRFLIYETPDNGRTLTMVGEALASGREQALRKVVEANPRIARDQVVLASVSENGIKLHVPPPRIGAPASEQQEAPAEAPGTDPHPKTAAA